MGRRVGNNPYISKTLISDPYKIIEDVVGEERLWKQHGESEAGGEGAGKIIEFFTGGGLIEILRIRERIVRNQFGA